MRVQLVRTFLVLAEVGSYRTAAEVLRYSESSVAYHLRELERAVGAPLVTRVGQRAELTEAGRAVLGLAVALVRSADSMVEAVRRSRRPVSAAGSTSAGYGAAARVLPRTGHAGAVRLPAPGRPAALDSAGAQR